MNLDQKREHEAAVYRSEYQKPHYKMGEQRMIDVRRLLFNTPRGTLLDVGTGRGEAMDIARSLWFHPVQGTETVPELIGEDVTFAWSVCLPFQDQSFDVVTCFDVMEHLIEEDLIPSIREFCRVAKQQVIVSCSEIPSSEFGGGRELHISRRPAAQWMALIQQASPGWTVTRDGEAGGSPAFRLTR